LAATVDAAFVAKQMLCSDDACAMYMTEMSALFNAPKRRWAMPGTPIIPAPSTLSNEMLSTVLKPHTHFSRINSPLGRDR